MDRGEGARAARVVIAIDGPSGSGKSSAARGVARRLGLRYLDTGAMYRALTWWMLREGVPVDDPEKVSARCHEPRLDVATDPRAPRIAIDGVDVSRPVRSREVTNAVSAVASVPAVRSRLIELQRQLIGDGGIVVEGRDIGTVVAPNADVKVYLTADPAERARRRAAEGLAGTRIEVGLAQTELVRRDRLDSNQLAMADDAVLLDTTKLDLEEVIDRIEQLANERINLSGAR